MILYNENKSRKVSSYKSKYDTKKSNNKSIQECDINSTSNDHQKDEIVKQKTSRHHRSASHMEKSLSSVEESRTNFMKLCELVFKLQKTKSTEREKMQKDMMRYNSLHKHIWNIYCVNDIFFRIINKFLIFQSDESSLELMNIVSSMNESSKKLSISSVITQLCTNFINMLIDIKNMNIYSSEYSYLITMMLSNVEKSLKKLLAKPTYWIKFIDDFIKVLLPSHIIESYNRPIENQSKNSSASCNNDNNDNNNTENNNISNEESEFHKLSNNETSSSSLIDTSWFKSNEVVNRNDTKTSSIPSIPSLHNENSTNVNNNKLSLPSLIPSSSSPFLPPISASASVPALEKMPELEQKLKRNDSFEPLVPISNSSNGFKSLSRSSSSSSINNNDIFYQVLSQHKSNKKGSVGIINEIKLFLIRSLLNNIEETICNCNFIPLNLCSIPLPSLKNHKRSMSVIQKKNTLINLPSMKVPLPPTSKKPKNQIIRKKNMVSNNNNKIDNTSKSTASSNTQKPLVIEGIDQKNNNKAGNEIGINIDDTTDSEIYDDFDSESSFDSRYKGSSSGSEDEEEMNNGIKLHKKTNIYEQETIYFIQFKLQEYIKSLKDYISELNDIQASNKNYLILSLQNLLEKHILLLQSYYKKTVASINSETSKVQYSRQRQHTSIEATSLNNRSLPPKIEPIKNPVILKAPIFKSNNSFRDPLILQNRLKVYSSLSSAKTPLHVNVTNIVLEPIRRNSTKIPSIKPISKPLKTVNI